MSQGYYIERNGRPLRIPLTSLNRGDRVFLAAPGLGAVTVDLITETHLQLLPPGYGLPTRPQNFAKENLMPNEDGHIVDKTHTNHRGSIRRNTW